MSCAAAATALSLAYAADLSGDPYGLWKPLKGAIYKFHSGIVADATPPTANDRRLTFLVDGNIAKEIFNSIGPDYPETCGSEKGDRDRVKKGIVCSYTAQDEKDKDGPYRCWIGLNLKTGDTIGTISC
ncbi:hypothetical protein E4O92_13565 [Massilia horti]|uniref:Uncharacterized protein n=2 Tax=Massilia horti TaxID=2562153 RepID=A0A4Y9T114_9BURK|nr:hypothetical protein E4O92_13565 [Massilia horti]